MDSTLHAHIERMHENLAKMGRLDLNADWLKQALFEEWINLGSPKITDYHIELINPTAANDAVPHSYIDRRPNATLRFSLPDVPLSRDQN